MNKTHQTWSFVSVAPVNSSQQVAALSNQNVDIFFFFFCTWNFFFYYYCSSGEILRLTHVARGLDAEGVLLIDVVINGFIPPSLSSSHLSLQVCLLKWPQCVLKNYTLTSGCFSDLCELTLLLSHRSLMSRTCKRAKGSCTPGHHRPTREKGSPWCCAVTTQLFTRVRRSARALCSSCSKSLGWAVSTTCSLLRWTSTSLQNFSYQVWGRRLL